jgi:hypothetical protein
LAAIYSTIMKKSLLFVVLLCGISAVAQRTCHTNNKLEQLKAGDPAFATYHQEVMDHLRNPQTTANRENNTSSPSSVVTIRVVFHVLYKNSTQNISDAQINSQLAILNADYRKLNADFTTKVPGVFQPLGADMEIVFVKATLTPTGAATTGVTRKSVPSSFVFEDDYYTSSGELAWDPMHYLNIWVGRFTDSSLLGFAYLPSSAGAPYDGLCIGDQYLGNTGTATAPYNKGRTATHEIGHYFGLDHPWGDGSCSSGDDGVADTPATDAPYFSCPTFPNNANACTPTTNGSMFMNYMDYVDDACMAFFTTGQKTIVQNTVSSVRSTLGVGEVSPLAQQISVYPNPASQYFTISSAQIAVDKVEIFSTTGQLVKTHAVSGDHKIGIEELESGVYFIRIYGDGKFLKSDKIIKK